MSLANVDVVRRALSALSETGDFRASLDLFDPEVVYEEDPGWPDSGVYRGRSAVVARLEGVAALIGELELAIEDVIDAGEGQVLAVFRLKARGTGSGVPVERPWAYLYELRDSRIVRFRAYMDAAEAREAAGLD